jgi:hypothetical protein
VSQAASATGSIVAAASWWTSNSDRWGLSTRTSIINVKSRARQRQATLIIRPVIGPRSSLQNSLVSPLDLFLLQLILGRSYCGKLGHVVRKGGLYTPSLPLQSSLEHDLQCAVAGADEVFYDILFLTNAATFSHSHGFGNLHSVVFM